jgi:hypothetical protein
MKVMIEVISPDKKVAKVVVRHLAGSVILCDGTRTKVIKNRQGNGLNMSDPHRVKKGRGSYRRRAKHKNNES